MTFRTHIEYLQSLSPAFATTTSYCHFSLDVSTWMTTKTRSSLVHLQLESNVPSDFCQHCTAAKPRYTLQEHLVLAEPVFTPIDPPIPETPIPTPSPPSPSSKFLDPRGPRPDRHWAGLGEKVRPAPAPVPGRPRPAPRAKPP